MRSTEIKIDGTKKQGVLVAGGPGFKVYTISDLDGWALALGRRISFIEDSNPAAQTVADYVNIRYHSIDLQEAIKVKFNQLIEALDKKHQTTNKESTLN